MQATPSPSLLDQGIPAPYGRACTNCARVKTKCMFRFNLNVCERCHRLKKDCQPYQSVRKRNVKKPTGSREGTVECPGSQRPLPQISPSHPVAGALLFTPESSLTSADPVTDAQVADVEASFDRFYPFKTTVTGCRSLHDDISAYKLSDGIADQNLATFRRTFLPFFPVVYIPDVMSSSYLRQQKPFLWLVVMALTTKDMTQQMAMGYTIGQIISQRMVAEHEKNLDLLLGLICYLAWFQFHKKDRPYLTMWTQVAVALVCELEIHKPPPGEENRFSSRTTWFPPRARIPRVRTLEERRAILGTYVITSMAWTSLRQIEPIRWTPYLDDHVRVLTGEKETELDEVLAAHVRCHVIRDQMTCATAEQDGENLNAPPPYFIKALQMQLQDVSRGLPPKLQTSQPILLDLYATEIIIHETILHKPRVPNQTGLPDHQRLAGLDSLLAAIERWFGMFNAIPNSEWIGTPFGTLTQYGHCTILLFKLTTLEEPGWDNANVKQRADLLELLERLASRFDTLPQELGLVDTEEGYDSGILFKGPKLIRGMRASFAAEINASQSQFDVPASQNPKTAELLNNVPDPDDVLMLLADDPFMAEMFCIHGPFDLYD